VSIYENNPEEIQRLYNASLDSVDLLNAGKPDFLDESEWAKMRKANVDHLKVMLGKTFWTNEQDLTVFQQAVNEHDEDGI